MATDDGFSAIGLIELIKPEASVTTKKVCFHGVQSDATARRKEEDTHYYEEYEVSRH